MEVSACLQGGHSAACTEDVDGWLHVGEPACCGCGAGSAGRSLEWTFLHLAACYSSPRRAITGPI